MRNFDFCELEKNIQQKPSNVLKENSFFDVDFDNSPKSKDVKKFDCVQKTKSKHNDSSDDVHDVNNSQKKNNQTSMFVKKQSIKSITKKNSLNKLQKIVKDKILDPKRPSAVRGRTLNRKMKMEGLMRERMEIFDGGGVGLNSMFSCYF